MSKETWLAEYERSEECSRMIDGPREKDFFDHKEGCLYNPDKPGWMHRAPIECTTREDFEKRCEGQKATIKLLEKAVDRLKVRIFDLENNDSEEW